MKANREIIYENFDGKSGDLKPGNFINLPKDALLILASRGDEQAWDALKQRGILDRDKIIEEAVLMTFKQMEEDLKNSTTKRVQS